MPENVGPSSEALSLALDLARIEGGEIVIRIAIAALPLAVRGGSDLGSIDPPLEVTDPGKFAPELVHALNREDEDGTTPIHKLLDDAVSYAADQSAEGVDPVERCGACDLVVKPGELVLRDFNEGGLLHADCCGPERESYTDEHGEPLGPDEPIPTGWPYQTDSQVRARRDAEQAGV